MGLKASIKLLGLSSLFGVLVLLAMSTFKSIWPPNPDANSSRVASESQQRPLEKRETRKELPTCRWEENSLGEWTHHCR